VEAKIGAGAGAGAGALSAWANEVRTRIVQHVHNLPQFSNLSNFSKEVLKAK
jgi:hypothetical protein